MENRPPYQTISHAPTSPPSQNPVDLQPIFKWIEDHAAPHLATARRMQVVLHFADGKLGAGDVHLLSIKAEGAK